MIRSEKYNDARVGKFQIGFHLVLIMRRNPKLHLVYISMRIITTHIWLNVEFYTLCLRAKNHHRTSNKHTHFYISKNNCMPNLEYVYVCVHCTESIKCEIPIRNKITLPSSTFKPNIFSIHSNKWALHHGISSHRLL